MILYALKCKQGHKFDAWFASSGAFDTQQRRGLLVCPVCATRKVQKALMAPNVAKPAKPGAAKRRVEAQRENVREAAPETQRLAIHRELATAVRKLRAEIEANSEYVGPRFCEEARKIHNEEAPARGIHGEATTEEAKALREEGIEFFPLPVLPEEHN
jgi:hypothetical protein